MNSGYIRVSASEQSISVFWTQYPVHGSKFGGIGSAEASNINGLWWINRVLLNPVDLRGQGIGSCLLRRLVKEIRKQKGKLILVTPGGYEQKKRKQFNFYRKNGFVNVTTEINITPKERKYTLVYE